MRGGQEMLRRAQPRSSGVNIVTGPENFRREVFESGIVHCLKMLVSGAERSRPVPPNE